MCVGHAWLRVDSPRWPNVSHVLQFLHYTINLIILPVHVLQVRVYTCDEVKLPFTCSLQHINYIIMYFYTYVYVISIAVCICGIPGMWALEQGVSINREIGWTVCRQLLSVRMYCVSAPVLWKVHDTNNSSIPSKWTDIVSTHNILCPFMCTHVVHALNVVHPPAVGCLMYSCLLCCEVYHSVRTSHHVCGCVVVR